MNIFEFHNSPRGFVDVGFSYLMQHEVENNLMIGIARNLVAQKSDSTYPETYFWLLKDHDSVTGAAMMTPPNDLVLSFGFTKAHVQEFVPYLHSRKMALPGILGPEMSAKQFAKQWTNVTGQDHELMRRERCHRLGAVSMSGIAAGEMKKGKIDSEELFISWAAGFMEDTGESGSPTDTIRSFLSNEQLYVWRDEVPVSMAAWTGATPNGVRISLVYTPPEYRNKGYATSLVSALSGMLLRKGYRFCSLYTDLSNPVSNSIYQKIGYTQVYDLHHYRFTGNS